MVVQGRVGVGQHRDDGDACGDGAAPRGCASEAGVGRTDLRQDADRDAEEIQQLRIPLQRRGGRAAGCERRSRPRWRALRSAATPATRPRCPPRCPRARRRPPSRRPGRASSWGPRTWDPATGRCSSEPSRPRADASRPGPRTRRRSGRPATRARGRADARWTAPSRRPTRAGWRSTPPRGPLPVDGPGTPRPPRAWRSTAGRRPARPSRGRGTWTSTGRDAATTTAPVAGSTSIALVLVVPLVEGQDHAVRELAHLSGPAGPGPPPGCRAR